MKSQIAQIVADFREGLAGLVDVAKVCITAKMHYKDMWHLLNALQVEQGMDWESQKQEICDFTIMAQKDARAELKAERNKAKAACKAPAMIDRVMAKYGV